MLSLQHNFAIIQQIRTCLNRFWMYTGKGRQLLVDRKKEILLMAETIAKDTLLNNMQEGYNEFEALLVSLSEAQMLMPEVNGSWSVKDNIAHLTAWQDYLISHLEGLLAGKEPPEFLPGLTSEDEQNEQLYQQNKHRPLAEVLSAFRASYRRAYVAVQALSEEALNA